MLDTRQAPPLSVPLRFFLTAPLFAVSGAGLLWHAGSTALLTRWSPLTLAILHCFTAGFMLQAMLGSLFQVLPVALGAPLPRPRLVAAIVHASITAGAALLCLGLLGVGTRLTSSGGALLAFGCTIFALACAMALWQNQARNPVRLLLRGAIAGLVLTAGLGFALALQLDFGTDTYFAKLFSLHALWGFAGWTLPLIAGVAILVVPMFYMTPRYPENASHKASWLGFAALLAASAATILGLDIMTSLSIAVLALLCASFGSLTLHLFRCRKRPRSDAALWGWYVAMAAMLATGILVLVRLLAASRPEAASLEIAVGIAAILGTSVGLIGAMQLRILPFLATLHLSPLGVWQLDREPGTTVQAAQIAFHGLAVLTLLAALPLPDLTRSAAAMLLIAQILEGITVWRIALAYRATRKRLTSKAG